jgi:hypothetical protein
MGSKSSKQQSSQNSRRTSVRVQRGARALEPKLHGSGDDVTYAKMMKVGVPKDGVVHKMKRDL